MGTIKEVLANQQVVGDRIYDLLMQGKEEEVLEIIAQLGYEIRTENGAPLDEKEGFDNEAHELAVFLNNIMQKVEKNIDITDFEATKVLRSAKQAVKSVTKDLLKTADIRRSLSDYDAEKYKKSMQKGIEESEAELERTQKDYDFMNKIDEEIFGTPSITQDITTKNNQIVALDKIKEQLEQIRKIEANMRALNPDDPDEARMIQNHKNKISELMSGRNGVENQLNAIKDGGLDISELEDAIRTDFANADRISNIIDSKKSELNLEVTKNYQQIMDNLKTVSEKYAAYKPFKGIDFSKMDPSTTEGRKAIEQGYRPFKIVFLDIERRRANAENNIENFNQEIETLDKERAILDKNFTTKNEYREAFDEETKRKIEEEKEEFHQDNRDRFYGNKEKAQKYREKFIEFKKHIVEKDLTYIDKDGVTRTVRGETIEDYPGMEEDLKFLRLVSYKERIERVSLYKNTKDLYAYDPELARRLDEATTDEQRNAIKKEFQEKFQQDSDYINTYHGVHNTTKLTYESYMTGGSALKAMVPIKSADTLGGKAKIALQNAVKYTGLKMPKFPIVDKDGEKVRDIKSGMATVIGDALIIGGTIWSPGAMAVAYAAKTAVVLGMRQYGKHYYKKHKDDMELPTPYDGTNASRRTARETYYTEKEHRSRVGAWTRAWIDELRRGRKTDIEDEIIEARNKEGDISVDNMYVAGAMKADREEKNKVIANQKARKSAHDQVKSSGSVYNDIYREPDMASKKGVDSKVNQAVALGMAGENIEDSSRIAFTESKKPRSTNFGKAKISIKAKIERALDENRAYTDVKAVGETILPHSIQGEDIARSVTRTTDSKRRILTMLTAFGLKAIGHGMNDTRTAEVEVEKGTGEYENVKVGEHQEREILGYEEKIERRLANPEDVKLGDAAMEDNASWGAFNKGDQYIDGKHPDVPSIAADEAQGIAYEFTDVDTGETIRYSISSKDVEDIIANNPHLNRYTVDYSSGKLGITKDTTYAELDDFLPKELQDKFNEYIQSFPKEEQLGAIMESTEFAWGKGIPPGWTKMLFDEKLRYVWDKTIDYSKPIYGDWKTIPDYELREIMTKVIETKEVTDPTLHAVKDALEKLGLATALQQLGEATNEVANPTKEQFTGKGARPFSKLDKPQDVAPRNVRTDSDDCER